VRRDRQILEARLGYQADCVCCDCETGNACPKCLGENLEYETYDFGIDRGTGYADSGERYYCRDCGATGEVDDTVAALVMLPQPTRQPMTSARASGVAGGGVMKTGASADLRTGGVSLETKYLHLRQPV
jgi:hypothetical protein